MPSSGEDESQDEDASQDRYWDPRSRTSFRFDHLSLVRSLTLWCYIYIEVLPFYVALRCRKPLTQNTSSPRVSWACLAPVRESSTPDVVQPASRAAARNNP